jgi:hypothetical protein
MPALIVRPFRRADRDQVAHLGVLAQWPHVERL